MVASPATFFAGVLLLSFPFILPAQEKPGKYYDLDKVLYKHITSTKEGMQTTWYDTSGNPLINTCNPHDPEYVRFADIQISIFRLLSERLKDDPSRQRKSVDFCFTVSDKGVSGIRLISYELRESREELQQLLETLIKELDLKTTAACSLMIEIPYWDYALDVNDHKGKEN